MVNKNKKLETLKITISQYFREFFTYSLTSTTVSKKIYNIRGMQ